jgi:asparagine synthase (glutamine-hydrolysing)
MCGIVAWLSNDSFELNDLISMTDVISHRGPDDAGYLISNPSTVEISEPTDKVQNICSNLNFGFSHRRLSIVDLSSHGHQPMLFRNRYWITYNGEIYNYIELRTELEKHGYSFNTDTDTEVILASYDAWGVECLNKFNGMWAFVLFDQEQQQLFVSRDRFGVKPLYYYQDEENLIFSSEIKSLLNNKIVKTSPNVDTLKSYWNEGPKEFIAETAFENIYRFDIASYILIDKSNFLDKVSEKKFWDYTSNNSFESFNEEKVQIIAKDYYDLLKDAVRIRLRADVDIGSALSGGLDSASIVYLINEILSEENSDYTQKTFSTVYKSEETKYCDESYYIDLLTSELAINSYQIEPKSSEISELHKIVIKYWESPPEGLGMSGLNTFKLVSDEGVKVTLDGQGADEQQAGYERYCINYMYNINFRAFVKEFWAHKKVQGLHKMLVVAFMFRILKSVLGHKLTMRLTKTLFKRDFEIFTKPLNEALKRDAQRGLINLIHYSDSRSMYYSIESRMPFMDYRLVEFTARIPACYKIHNGWSKYFARLAFDKKLPNEICWRRDKMGWPTPDKIWQQEKEKALFESEILNSSFLKQHFSINSLENFNKKKINRLLNIAVWYKTFFGKGGRV